MDENKKAAQKKKVTHFITMAVLVILFIAFIFPFIMVIINAFVKDVAKFIFFMASVKLVRINP